jgi:hypothetical protein
MQDDSSSQNTGVVKKENKGTYLLLRTERYNNNVENTGYKVHLHAAPNNTLFIKLSAQNEWRLPYQRRSNGALVFIERGMNYAYMCVFRRALIRTLLLVFPGFGFFSKVVGNANATTKKLTWTLSLSICSTINNDSEFFLK